MYRTVHLGLKMKMKNEMFVVPISHMAVRQRLYLTVKTLRILVA